MTTVANLPDPDCILFPLDDQEHAEDSACVAFPNDCCGLAVWDEMVEQYQDALSELVATAPSHGHGQWTWARPILFLAHHALELALKRALANPDGSLPKEAIKPQHNLRQLLREERKVRGTRGPQSQWEDAIVEKLDRAWEASRYPVGREGAERLFNQWCCESPRALLKAVNAFIGLIDARTPATTGVVTPQ